MKDPPGQSKLNLKRTSERHSHFTEELFHLLLFSNSPTQIFFLFFFLMHAGKGFDGNTPAFRLNFPWEGWRWGKRQSILPSADPPGHRCGIMLGLVGCSDFAGTPSFRRVFALCSSGKRPHPKPCLGSLRTKQAWDFPAGQQRLRTERRGDGTRAGVKVSATMLRCCSK